MKAKLIFNIDDKEDDLALKRCHKSLAMAMVIFEFTKNGRDRIEDEMTEKELEAVDKVYNRFYDLLDEYSIMIDELID